MLPSTSLQKLERSARCAAEVLLQVAPRLVEVRALADM